MDLNTFWFVLIAILFAGFFFLEGFDYGIGILLPFVSDRDTERRLVINSIGNVWDGNEVWLIGAGGAIFAAFPLWYSTLFSSFYMALVFILLALGLRGISIELRSKSKFRRWRAFYDICLFISSSILAILWGVFVGNIIRGLPIAEGIYMGNFFSLLNIYSLISGILFLLIFAYHGAVFLRIKIDQTSSVWYSVNNLIPQLHRITSIWFLFFVLITIYEAKLIQSPMAFSMFAVGFALFVLSGISQKRNKLAFLLCGLSIIITTLAVFVHSYPHTLISNLYAEWSLTIYNSCSSQYSLKIMMIIAVILVPIIIIYQAASYYLFRKRLTAKDLKY
ncbi:MAG TPA: cytochrome d ubiquinol oxidase subunit II [Lentisphaeria bacterium]|nr:MAG: cytochrome d ubiquinol oxidase subunit II [Lentisphaerae bacterium GWF2_38_69]HBM15153.1 cytochrome d ubiquinol oxidase subunit II [Lentisphaeria bacterium]